MHWLCYNDAVSWLNKAKTRIFQPTANFEKFNQNLPVFCLPASQPACLPAVRPGCARCRAPEISHDKIMAADLRKCCSEDDLSTAPWRFFLCMYDLKKYGCPIFIITSSYIRSVALLLLCMLKSLHIQKA